MKKILLSIITVSILLFVFSGCTDTQMKTDVQKLQEDVAKLQETVTKLQTTVDSLNMKLMPKEEVKSKTGAPTNTTDKPVKQAPPKTK